MVLYNGYFGLRVQGAGATDMGSTVVVFPSHGMNGVAPEFAPGGESPMPDGLAPARPFGLAIGVRCATWNRESRDAPSIFLVALRDKGRVEPAQGIKVYGPWRAPQGVVEYGRQGLVGLLSTPILAPKTTYRATANVPRADDKPPFAYEKGPKDVAYLGENETVRVIMRFEGLGKYMVHCHNLVHEDHDMMSQFEVIGPTPGDDPLGTPPKPVLLEPDDPL